MDTFDQIYEKILPLLVRVAKGEIAPANAYLTIFNLINEAHDIGVETGELLMYDLMKEKYE